MVLATIAVLRVVATYSQTAQGFDEPCHISAAIEWLDRHTYTLDPVHPPLSRVAIGLPLYLAGEQYPHLPANEPDSHNYNVVGNAILYRDGHYQRNLILARVGVLPFFLITIALVYKWTQRNFGDPAGIFAVALFSTLPTVLAFSGLAYTDVPTACTQTAALFAFTAWLERPSIRSSALLGFCVALALLTKMTSLLFLPAGFAAILFCRCAVLRRTKTAPALSGWFERAALAGAVTLLVFWAGYGFSIGHVQDAMQITPASLPSFQHFPAPVASVARSAVLSNWLLPMPAFIKGLATSWILNNTHATAYLLGHVREGGWWYFFLVGLAVKIPVPFLILCFVGSIPLWKRARSGDWSALAPAACAAAILVAATSVKYNAGVRHVMVVFPLLAIIAAAGASYLWTLRRSQLLRAILIGLLAWHALSTAQASGDFLAYFNEFAGSDASRVLVTGCDLDCGQDVLRLVKELHDRKIASAHLALWSSAEMTSMGLPPFDVPGPYQPVKGWLAVSARALRMNDVFHQTYPAHAFAWLDQYRPVALVGKTIRLYYIPE